MFRKILLATDGSDHSEKSARYAVELAEKFKGTITIIHVVEEKLTKSEALNYTSTTEKNSKVNEKIESMKVLIKKTEIKFDTHVLYGKPGPLIVQYANNGSFDCVILGSRGLNKLQSFILGSVSNKVAKWVRCPVLIVN